MARNPTQVKICYVDMDVATYSPVTEKNICTVGEAIAVPASDPVLSRLMSLVRANSGEFSGKAVRVKIVDEDGEKVLIDAHGNARIATSSKVRAGDTRQIKNLMDDLFGRFPRVAPVYEGDPFSKRRFEDSD